MKTLLTIIGIIAAILFLALFVLIAWIKHDLNNELSRDAMIQNIRHKVDELNEAYSQTKKLAVDFGSALLHRPKY